MATRIRAARAKSRMPARVKLTPYESDQISQIAAWKSIAPGPVAEFARKITFPASKVVEKAIPDGLVRGAIEQSFRLAVRLAGKDEVKRRAGVDDLGDLRNKPLEECDRLAHETERFFSSFCNSARSGTGAGGVLTTLIDIPLLFILSLRTILKVGHCYGYSLDRRRDQHFVLGVLIAAVSGTLATKRHRLDRLHELEDWLIQELTKRSWPKRSCRSCFNLKFSRGFPASVRFPAPC